MRTSSNTDFNNLFVPACCAIALWLFFPEIVDHFQAILRGFVQLR